MESLHCRSERFLKDLSVQLSLLSVEESGTQESDKLYPRSASWLERAGARVRGHGS